METENLIETLIISDKLRFLVPTHKLLRFVRLQHVLYKEYIGCKQIEHAV